MAVFEIEAKSLLRKHTKVDSWFVARYGMNLYRGCMHNCVYCDGRAEKYNVEGDFGRDVAVKVNAIDVLQRELDPRRKRTPMKRGFIMLGGGVGDSYQPIEKQYRLTRRVLGVFEHAEWPVHVLTKSTMVTEDLPVISAINNQTRAVVSFSFSSVSDEISAVFEPGVSLPSERLLAIKRFKEAGIACGIYLMPVIPYITDTSEFIEHVVQEARRIGVDFMVFSGMTLKSGRQQEYFMHVLRENYPEHLQDYEKLYPGNKFGSADGRYYRDINLIFTDIARTCHMPQRMPRHLFQDILDENDRVIVMLEHIDHFLKLKGARSPYGFAAYSLSKIKEPLSEIRYELTGIKGVGPGTARMIQEILDTGTSELYEKLVV
jgi:DNA repair photolyase